MSHATLVWRTLACSKQIAAWALAVVCLCMMAPFAFAPAHAADIKANGLQISSWAIQLQNDTTDAVANAPYDLVVVDYSRDGSDNGAFTADDVAAMKVKPDGSRRLVIAYVSIGEAENYRYYWRSKWKSARRRPSYIMRQNPEWAGNYSVKFWEKGWQDIIIDAPDSYINRVLQAGFDGVYLDKIDVTDDVENYVPGSTSALDLMVGFVGKISTVAKQNNPDFLVIASNAEALLPNDTYRAVIDGIGKEDILYQEQPVDGSYKDGFTCPPDQVTATEALLNYLIGDNKLVLAVEYLDDPAEINAAAAQYAQLGYVSYFGPRSLAKLALPAIAAAAK